MNFIVSIILLIVGVTQAAVIPLNPCATAGCTMSLKLCPDGTPAPIPVGGCCPSLTACKKPVITNPIQQCLYVMCTTALQICPDGTRAPVPTGQCCPSMTACRPIQPIGNDCSKAICPMDLKICPDGSLAGKLPGGCCPTLSACATSASANQRSLNLGSLGNLLSGSNILSTLSGATHGTDIGTVLSILNTLNAVHQLSNDVHQIPTVINNTIQALLNGTGQAGQVLLQQLVNSVTGGLKPVSADGRALNLGSLGNLLSGSNILSTLSGATHGTDIGTVLSILNTLNAVHQLSNDIHQIPTAINSTIQALLTGTGQAGQVLLQQLLNTVTAAPKPTSRNLLSSLGQNTNLLSGISSLIPHGTSLSSVMSILGLLNNVHQLTNDVHQIPVVLNQTLTSILNGVQHLIQPLQPLISS